MARCVKAPLSAAEEARRELSDANLVDESFYPGKDEKYLYIPVKEGYEKETVEKELVARTVGKDFHEALKEILTEQELAKVKTAYDQVGEIAILEIDKELRHKEKKIGEALLESLQRIKTVVRKDGKHEGELRVQQYKVLAGKKDLETEVVENGVMLKLQIDKTYYSVRSATERKRISELVQPGERVLVMFAGIGPFTCTIAKNSEASEVIGVELNKEAHRYAKENIKINKLANAKAIKGDVRKIVPELGGFDRILMPLPHTAKDFLDVAAPACKKWIHLYHFSSEEEAREFALTIPERLKQLGKQGTVEHIERCGNLAPGIHRWCLDIKIQ